MSTEQIIIFHSGPYRLVGTLHLPHQQSSRRPAPVVIGCHGLLANRHSPKQLALAQACTRQGIAYFRFDHQGCGDSSGDLAAGALLAARCRDLSAAVAILARQPTLGPLLGIFGSSFGGTVALSYAAECAARCLATYAAPYTSKGLGIARIAADMAPGLAAALADNWNFNIRPCLSAQHHLLVLHSAGDTVVPADHAREIHSQAQDPKQLIIFEGGDHPLSDPQLQVEFLSHAVAWFQMALKHSADRSHAGHQG